MSRDGDACQRPGCNLSRRQHEDVGEIDHEFTPPESRSVQGAGICTCGTAKGPLCAFCQEAKDHAEMCPDGCPVGCACTGHHRGPCQPSPPAAESLAPETPCTCITANDRAVCVGWCKPVAGSPKPGQHVFEEPPRGTYACRLCGKNEPHSNHVAPAESPKGTDDALCISCGKQRPEQTVGCAECLGWLAGFNAGREQERTALEAHLRSSRHKAERFASLKPPMSQEYWKGAKDAIDDEIDWAIACSSKEGT